MPSQSGLTSILLPISILIIVFAIQSTSNANLDFVNEIELCHHLPHSNYLSAEDLNRVCQHRKQWIHDREHQNDENLSERTESQREYLKWLEGTRNFRVERKNKKWRERFVNGTKNCGQIQRMRRQHEFAPLMKGDNGPKNPPPKGRRKFIRKEYRAMSDLERKQLQKALNGLKQHRIDNITIWDLHILVHYPHSAPAAHWGPAFLPWHREFLRQFEAALQNEVPDLVGLPYWDSTLDYGLPDPVDSILWADELMGNGNGFVSTGPFKDWDTNVLMPLSPVPIKRLFRSTGGRNQDRLMSPADVDWIVGRSNFSELTFCHDKTFESMHGLSHVWVGGFMFVIRVSPNDPTFYFHHAFMDFLWEQFRQRNQNRWQRENDYAQKTCNKQHNFDAQMKPFNLQNRDGLSNDYTDFWFEYEPIRHCSPQMPFCDSKFLFCDKLVWRCRSRIQLGGNCTGFGGTEICYESICIQNVCRVPATEGNGFQRQERQHEGVVWAKSLMLTDESRPLSSGIAHVTVRDQQIVEGNNNSRMAFLERNAQYPETTGLLYLPLPNPKNANTDYNVSLEAIDHYGRYCQSYCLNGTTEKYQVCEPKLVLRSGLGGTSSIASNISFTHQIGARKFLDMDLSIHPKTWKVYSPFIVFNCQRKLLNSALVKEITDQLLAPVGQSSPFVWFRVGLLKKPGSSLDLDSLQIEAEDLGGNGELFQSSVRQARSPYDQSVVILRARNPLMNNQPQEGKGITVKITIRKEGIGIECDVRCNPQQENFAEDICLPQVRLHSIPELSQEQAFSPELSYLPYLGWRMIGHPAEWRLKMPYLSLYC